MKKTNKCEMCGKRYNLPMTSEGMEIREYICFTCEFCLDFIGATLQVVESQRGFKFTEKKLKRYRELIKLLKD
jgi:hypothetical protein